jgi:hypothetical protein
MLCSRRRFGFGLSGAQERCVTVYRVEVLLGSASLDRKPGVF